MSLSAEDEVGPYYLDDRLFRSNITESEVGIPVTFIVSVIDTSCSPIADVYVDIWHCNSTGYYSGYLCEPTPCRQASCTYVINLHSLLDLEETNGHDQSCVERVEKTVSSPAHLVRLKPSAEVPRVV